MDLNSLRKIGLTEGEIRVYQALISLGKSSTGNIMKRANISSSKVYLILDRLIKKGLVSFIVQNNVKYFQPTNPKTILDYIEGQREDLEKTKIEFEEIIPSISSHIKYEEESAQVYKGLRGIRVAYENILMSLKKGESYDFFAISNEEAQDKKTLDFLSNFHKKRIEKGIYVRVIADSSIEELYKRKHLLGKLYIIKHYPLTLPTGIVVGKNRILFITFGAEPTAYELVSRDIAKKYQIFFDKLWKIAKK